MADSSSVVLKQGIVQVQPSSDHPGDEEVSKHRRFDEALARYKEFRNKQIKALMGRVGVVGAWIQRRLLYRIVNAYFQEFKRNVLLPFDEVCNQRWSEDRLKFSFTKENALKDNQMNPEFTKIYMTSYLYFANKKKLTNVFTRRSLEKKMFTKMLLLSPGFRRRISKRNDFSRQDCIELIKSRRERVDELNVDLVKPIDLYKLMSYNFTTKMVDITLAIVVYMHICLWARYLVVNNTSFMLRVRRNKRALASLPEQR